MTATSSRRPKTMAALSYLLPVVGPVVALLFGRAHLATWHALQSLLLTLILIVTGLIWTLLAWVLNWIPILGAIAGVMLFALVPLAFIALLIAHVVGIRLALQGSFGVVPFFGTLLGSLLPVNAGLSDNG